MMQRTPTQDDRNTNGADFFPFDGTEEVPESEYDRRQEELEQALRERRDELIENGLISLHLEEAGDSPDEIRALEAFVKAQIDKVRSLLEDLAETYRIPTVPFDVDKMLEGDKTAHHLLALLMLHGYFAHARDREGAEDGIYGWLYGGRSVKNGARYPGILQETARWVGRLSDNQVRELIPCYLAEYGVHIPYGAQVWDDLPWEGISEKRLDAAIQAWIRYLVRGDGKTVTVTRHSRPDRPFVYSDRLVRGGEVEARITPADRVSTMMGAPEMASYGAYGFPRAVVEAVEAVFPSGQKRAEVFLIRNSSAIRNRMAHRIQPGVQHFARTLVQTMRFPVSTAPAYRLAAAIYWATTRQRSTRGWALDAAGLTADDADAIIHRAREHQRFVERFFWKTFLDDRRLTEHFRSTKLIAGLF